MEQRPYRPNARDARFSNLVVLACALVAVLALNEWITLHMAHVMGDARSLGVRRYPFDWWPWWRLSWRYAPLHPYWLSVLKIEVYGLLIIAVCAGLILAHLQKRGGGAGLNADLHGSARWATLRDIQRAGLLPRRRKHRHARRGVCVGRWHKRMLVDAGEGHVLVTAPTRTGKGVGVVIPTLLTWPGSVFINDIASENWELTAGWRKSRGHKVLKFDPTSVEGSVKYNPLAEVRLGTVYEQGDANTIAHALIYPSGSQHDDYWHDAAISLLTGAILHVLHEGSDPTLHGVQWLFSDPALPLEKTLAMLLKSPHPLIASAMREFSNKAPKEASGVAGQMMSILGIYRDPIIQANTAASEFRIDDLMNYEHPVSLYLVVQFRDQERLKPLIRILIQQIVHHYTGEMTYKDGRAVAAHRYPMLMMLDEFPTLGRFPLLEKTLALVAKYGIRVCVIAQDVVQIKDAYGPNQSIVSNCATQVSFTPNDIETARHLSLRSGVTTVRRQQHSRSSSGYVTASEPETSRDLIDQHEVSTLSPDHALIHVHGFPTIYAQKLRHWKIPAMRARTLIPPPTVSDRIYEAVPKPIMLSHEISHASRRAKKPPTDQTDMFPRLV
jgi:type IV secretion system protein VirD4